MYLGDCANAPFGVKSYEEIANLTWEGVRWLFDHGCDLVVLACNTASAQALRTIQQTKLHEYPGKRVLGIIIPTVEEIVAAGDKKVALLGTPATVASGAYLKEFWKLDRDVRVIQHACIDWVPIVEQGRVFTEEAEQIVRTDVECLLEKMEDPQTILLACTHYPVLFNLVRDLVPEHINIYEQGPMVAERLVDYLRRHPEMDGRLKKDGVHEFYTTSDARATTRVSEQISKWQAPFQAVDLHRR